MNNLLSGDQYDKVISGIKNCLSVILENSKAFPNMGIDWNGLPNSKLFFDQPNAPKWDQLSSPRWNERLEGLPDASYLPDFIYKPVLFMYSHHVLIHESAHCAVALNNKVELLEFNIRNKGIINVVTEEISQVKTAEAVALGALLSEIMVWGTGVSWQLSTGDLLALFKKKKLIKNQNLSFLQKRIKSIFPDNPTVEDYLLILNSLSYETYKSAIDALPLTFAIASYVYSNYKESRLICIEDLKDIHERLRSGIISQSHRDEYTWPSIPKEYHIKPLHKVSNLRY